MSQDGRGDGTGSAVADAAATTTTTTTTAAAARLPGPRDACAADELVVHDTDSVEGAGDDAWAALANRNVMRVLLFCLLDGASYSIWQQQVFQVLIHQLAGDTAVGWMSAASGVMQMCSAVVAGLWGDALPRHTVLRAGAVAGVAAVLLSAVGIYTLNMSVLYAAQTLWGAYAGVVATGTEAIYADSVATGRRAFVYNVKWMAQTLSSCVGLVATIALLVHLGNQWERSSMVATIYVGLCVHPLAMVTLCSLHDRYSLHEEHALSFVAVPDDTAATAVMMTTTAGAGDVGGRGSGKDATPGRDAAGGGDVYASNKDTQARATLAQSSSTLHLLAQCDATSHHDDDDDDPTATPHARGGAGEADRQRRSPHGEPRCASTVLATADGAAVVCQAEDARADADETLSCLCDVADTTPPTPVPSTTTTTTTPAAAAAARAAPMVAASSRSAVAARTSCEARAKSVARQREQCDAAAWRDYARRQEAVAAAAAAERALCLHGGDGGGGGGGGALLRWLRLLLQRACIAIGFYAQLPFTWSAVPYLVCLVDFLVAFGSGMTLRYLNLYFVEDYHTSPSMLMTATLLTCPTQAVFSCVVQYAGDYYVGRIPATILIRLVGATLLLLMGATHLPLGVLLPIYVLRNAMTNSVRGVTRSVIMDAVRRENRAKWSAFESFSSFTWSGSAIIGGYIAEAHSYQYTFKITALVHYCALAVLVPAIVGARHVERELMRAKREKALARKHLQRGQ